VPIYPYLCPEHGSFDVIQSVHEQHEHQECPTCRQVSNRIWQPSCVSVDNSGGFNPGLGCVVRNKSDIRDIQRRYHDDTGSHLIEMGNETKVRAQRNRALYPTASEIGY